MNKINETLLQLAEEADGLLTTDAVLDVARDPDSPLHPYFEWDDSVAASAYRRWQARALIASCRVTLQQGETLRLRTFVSVPSDRNHGGGYRLRVSVLDDPDRLRELQNEILERVRYWQNQAKTLSPRLVPHLQRLEQSLQAEAMAN